MVYSFETYCVWDASHIHIGSFPYLKHMMILTELCLPSDSSAMQVSPPTLSAFSVEAHCYLLRLSFQVEGLPLLPGDKGHFLITNLFILLFPNFTLRLAFKYLSTAFRILQQSIPSHTLLLFMLVLLPKISSLSHFRTFPPAVSYQI